MNSALEKTSLEEEKLEAEDNAQTIRPGRSPSLLNNVPLPASPSLKPVPAVDDYSDLLIGEDDVTLQNKFADFKVNPNFFWLPACILITHSVDEDDRSSSLSSR